MSSILSLRKGITSAIAAFTGALGEVVNDTTKRTLVVHDGATLGGFPLARSLDVQSGDLITAVAAGTANALTATLPTVNSTAYVNGQPFVLMASAANTGAVAVVLTLGSTAQASVPLVKAGNAALIPGDIPAAGYPILVNYSATYGALVMQNPASVPVQSQIQSITHSVAANALTVGLNPTTLAFRSATLASGVSSTIVVAAALSLVVPSGATLGTLAGIQARLAILALDNAGVVSLGITTLFGGVNLDETTLVSTTAMSAGATNAGVIYSAAALTNVPFRVVGYIDITEAAAGTWATDATAAQGVGGQALAALSSIGYGQKWNDVSGSRVLGTVYTNTTGKPIMVWAQGISPDGVNTIGIAVFGFNSFYGSTASSTNIVSTPAVIIPPGVQYEYTLSGGSVTMAKAYELR